jgi:4-hydroxybenzoate polyprenyltransferase
MSESEARIDLVQPTVGPIGPEVVFPEDYPLCVDLDGTLLCTDSLLETWVTAFRRNPLRCLWACLQVLRSRARLKSALAAVAIPLADQLPYREAILKLIRREAAAGREIVLSTGAAEPVAEAVAGTVGGFDAVLSSNAHVNHTSHRKAAELEKRFGRGRFYYAGNSTADLPVWRGSGGAVVVGESRLCRELEKSGVPVIAQFPGERLSPSLLAQAVRVHQWSKNLLVFVPILLGHRFRDLGAWSSAAILLVAISLCASAAYMLNDLMDLEADRAHPEKRQRPFASGALGLGFGFAGIPLLLASAGGLSWFLPASTRLWLCAYLALTFTYSVFLKERLLVDVFVLAGLYTLRVLAGGSATGIAISPWTLAFSMFLFLSLAMVKRYSELVSASGTSDALPRRNYYRSDLNVLSSLGTASGYIAVLVLALYIHSPEVTNLYRHPLWLWVLCPLVAYWISRMWVFANRGAISSDPILFALRDRISYLVGGLSAALFLLASR